MLVLSRKISQSIVFKVTADELRKLADAGEELSFEMKCLDVDAESQRKSNFKIKLGFEAPQEVKIYRNELLEKKDGEKNAAVASNNGQAVVGAGAA